MSVNLREYYKGDLDVICVDCKADFELLIGDYFDLNPNNWYMPITFFYIQEYYGEEDVIYRGTYSYDGSKLKEIAET